MLDCYNREINYLRVSVTNKCNLRCIYCMPEEGVSKIKHEDVLSFEEIVNIIEIAVKNGINKIRLTGGEPLVRNGIVNLVGMIAKVNGITDFSMTTNGILLKKYAALLVNAGLQRINISLDSINEKTYKKITRIGNILNVLDGIKAAMNAGLRPIKLNCVVSESSKEFNAQEVRRFADKNNFEIRFIRKMDLLKGNFWPVEGGDGGNCKSCNRLRLSFDGLIKPCLFGDIAYSIRELGPEKALHMAISSKPELGKVCNTHQFYTIGG